MNTILTYYKPPYSPITYDDDDHDDDGDDAMVLQWHW